MKGPMRKASVVTHVCRLRKGLWFDTRGILIGFLILHAKQVWWEHEAVPCVSRYRSRDEGGGPDVKTRTMV